MSDTWSPELRALQTALSGQYVVERELGRGGMGIVFLARDVALDRPVAIKLLPPALATAAQRDRFLQEARTAARLAHPHIVPIHAVEQRGDLVFFVMGYIAGTTLAERVRTQGPLDPATATRMMQEVAWALAHAHQHGVVHRDIKPENILLERGTGRAVVTDFGIARGAGAASSGPQRVVGTARFMSPEQAAGAPVDGRSDLYSLGVTAFYALTGRYPFDAAEVPALLVQQQTLPAPPIASLRSGLSPALAIAIDRCLAREPADRPNSAADLADAVALEGERSATPAILQRIAREVSAFGVDLTGYGTLAAVAVIVELIKGGDLFGMRRVYTLTLSLVLIALTALRGMSLSRLVREAVSEGWEERDLAGAIEREARRRAATTSLPRPGRPAGAAIFLAGVAVLVAYWLGPKELSLNSLEGPLAWAIELIGLSAPVAWGRWFGARLEAPYGGRPGLFSRLVKTFKLKGFFWLARLRRQPKGPVAMLSDQHTEVVIADAARDILRALPNPDRRLAGVEQLLARLEADAVALRRRLGELDDAAARLGGAASPRRDEVERDLQAARRTAADRLGTTVSAMENLRLDLLRLQAGLTHEDRLTEDLDALRDLSARVDAELELRRD
ncbi:MAG TPA: serine/threonine-protein kinase [Gemmatimonadales bacterium]|nr:serine/threonine-protein kinase [Gemmatimonadales bacterium]